MKKLLIGTTTLILTSNNKFYGGLERRVLQFYSASIAKLSTDQILLGRSASDFFNKKAIILEEDLGRTSLDQSYRLQLGHERGFLTRGFHL